MKSSRPFSVAVTTHEEIAKLSETQHHQQQAYQPTVQFRTNVVKRGQLKLKISTDSTRPEFFMHDGVRFKELFGVLSRTEKHAENQWVLHRCELFFYQRSEDHDAGNDPLVRE